MIGGNQGNSIRIDYSYPSVKFLCVITLRWQRDEGLKQITAEDFEEKVIVTDGTAGRRAKICILTHISCSLAVDVDHERHVPQPT